MRIIFSQLQVATKQSSADMAGTLDDLAAPHGTLSIIANVAIPEMVRELGLPIDPAGSAVVDGKLAISFGSPFEFGISGRLTARGLRYRYDRLKVEDAEVRGNLTLSEDRVAIQGMTAQGLGANVTGQAALEHWRQLHVEGTIAGLDMRRAAGIVTDRPMAWNGILAGGFALDATLGQADTKARANLSINPSTGASGAPLQGHIDVSYDQAVGTIALGSSVVATLATRVELCGHS